MIMVREDVCSKKDKRLLVLLALGAMITFSDLHISENTNSDLRESAWLEIQDSPHELYRINMLNEHLFPIQRIPVDDYVENLKIKQKLESLISPRSGRALALKYSKNKKILLVSVSPRLAFFLGMPFSINSATLDDLTLVHGIGPALAGNIITYRQKNGPLTSADELEKVSGIGRIMKQRLYSHFTYTNEQE